MSKKETTYNLVLGAKEDGTVVILEYTFAYSGTCKGATGSELEPVTQAQIDEALADDEKTEWYEELWRMDAGTTNGTEKSLVDYVAEVDDDDYLESRFETYQTIDADTIAATIEADKPARYALTSLGRIFPRALDGITLVDSDEVRAAVASILEHEARP